ncbi:MAG: 2-hydroxyhepta-2,4-diene-1,7-dioate isomerase [Gammaproteobacteria bacterium]|nr:2-hydroxyhepta-2,4-diene-1,7-dioate isomerase [Gammaproteobacteria bacterium]|tara:strand:+ start:3316 stop:4083 length:768 start_codon:yes stop_codon:yes gene_type:complete
MSCWIRFKYKEKICFGLSEDTNISVYDGDMFSNPKKTDQVLNHSDVKMLNPCCPSKFIALWNNYQTLAKEKGLNKPKNPLYLNKAISSIINPGENIIRPKSYDEAIFYEGELGIVIGKKSKDIDPDQSKENIFGYTCINDVTAMDIVKKDSSFDQWTRSKGFDTFGIFGPCIATDIDPMNLQIQSKLNGDIVQNYNTSDMFFNVYEIVSFLSKDMTLLPGDVIACGTNAGLGPMLSGDVIEVKIDNIGKILNTNA